MASQRNETLVTAEIGNSQCLGPQISFFSILIFLHSKEISKKAYVKLLLVTAVNHAT